MLEQQLILYYPWYRQLLHHGGVKLLQCWEPSQSCSSEHGSFHPGFQYLSQMEKAATDMMSGVKLGPGSSHGHLKVYHDVNPIRESDGKVDEGVGLEVALRA